MLSKIYYNPTDFVLVDVSKITSVYQSDDKRSCNILLRNEAITLAERDNPNYQILASNILEAQKGKQ